MAPALPALPTEDHVCDTCAFRYADVDIDAAVAMIEAVPGRARALASSVAAPRARPAEGVWSVVEYVCHLRDVYASSTIRLYRVRTEDEPALEPMLNDLRAIRFRYNELDLAAVLDELERTVAGFLDEVARVRPDGWTRTASRLPGEARTAYWFVRHAAHEGVHHTADIERIAEGR